MISVGSPLGVLVAVCTYSCALSFLVALPSILSTPLQLYLALPEPKYAYLVSALFSVYSIPNILLPFFAGPLLRQCGERRALLLTLSSVALGQIVVAYSIQMRMQWGMIAGRFLFGLGGEIISVRTYEILTRWLRKHFSIAFGILISTTKIAMVVTSIAMQRLYESHGIVAATWLSTWLALTAAFLSVCYLACIRHEKPPDTESLLNSDTGPSTNPKPKAEAEADCNFLAVLASYPYVFWLLGMICILGHGSIETFGNSAQRFLASVFYAGNQQTAVSVMGIRAFFACIAIPPLGYILDRSFLIRAPTAILVASMLLLLTHTLFLTMSSAVLPLAIMGMASAIFSVSFYSSLSQCLFTTVKFLQQEREKKQQNGYGTIVKSAEDDAYGQEIVTLGFGCMTSVANLAAACIPVLLAMAESAMGYQGLEIVFWVLAFLSCLVAGHLVFISRYIE